MAQIFQMFLNFAQLHIRNKLTEQKKSIATGPLYEHTKFKAIQTLIPKNMVVLNPMGYLTLYCQNRA